MIDITKIKAEAERCPRDAVSMELIKMLDRDTVLAMVRAIESARIFFPLMPPQGECDADDTFTIPAPDEERGLGKA